MLRIRHVLKHRVLSAAMGREEEVDYSRGVGEEDERDSLSGEVFSELERRYFRHVEGNTLSKSPDLDIVLGYGLLGLLWITYTFTFLLPPD